MSVGEYLLLWAIGSALGSLIVVAVALWMDRRP